MKYLDIWILVKQFVAASPLCDLCGAALPGAFFSEKTRSWIFGPHLGDFLIFLIKKRRGTSTNPGTQSMSP